MSKLLLITKNYLILEITFCKSYQKDKKSIQSHVQKF